MHLGIRSRWTVFKGLGHHRKGNVQAEKRCKSSALGPSTVHRSCEREGGSQGDGGGVAREVGGGPQEQCPGGQGRKCSGQKGIKCVKCWRQAKHRKLN